MATTNPEAHLESGASKDLVGDSQGTLVNSTGSTSAVVKADNEWEMEVLDKVVDIKRQELQSPLDLAFPQPIHVFREPRAWTGLDANADVSRPPARLCLNRF
jgi:hypothetical protein